MVANLFGVRVLGLGIRVSGLGLGVGGRTVVVFGMLLSLKVEAGGQFVFLKSDGTSMFANEGWWW